jgi:hypothetical protein
MWKLRHFGHHWWFRRLPHPRASSSTATA